MKLYTQPRVNLAHLLRPGDHIAVSRRKPGQIIRSEVSYVDENLAEQIQWSVVHVAFEVEGARPIRWRIRHTLGEDDQPPTATVITREAIEIDPWTYVKSERQ